MNKFYEKIKMVNAVLIFLFLVGAIGVSAFSVFKMFFDRRGYNDRGVEIVQNVDRPTEEKEVKIYNFSRKIKDTYIFRKLNDTIDEEELMKVKANNSKLFYSGYFKSENIINLVFVNKEKNTKKTLFPNDLYIYNVRYAEFPKGIKGKIYNEFDKDYDLEYNLYQIIDEDTNNNNKLNEYDNIKLYKSDYNGENMKLITENFIDYKIISENTIVYKTAENNSLSFFEYDLKKDKKNKIFDENLFQ